LQREFIDGGGAQHLEEVKEEARTQGGRGDMVQMKLTPTTILVSKTRYAKYPYGGPE
jgi:hypothetical protein